MRRWDNGSNVLLTGDAAGTVAPSSGEDIFYAMLCGELAADAVSTCLATGNARSLREARRRFMRDHGKIFFILGIMQTVWYRSDKMREKFVTMCADPDVQRLTWESYLNKKLVFRDPFAHFRVFIKDTRWISVIAVSILWVETAAICLLSPKPLLRLRLLLANTLSGSCLLAALGLALSEGSPLAIAALLGGSLIAHAVDMVLRLAGQAPGLRRRT
eukprot:gene60278-82463_t